MLFWIYSFKTEEYFLFNFLNWILYKRMLNQTSIWNFLCTTQISFFHSEYFQNMKYYFITYPIFLFNTVEDFTLCSMLSLSMQLFIIEQMFYLLLYINLLYRLLNILIAVLVLSIVFVKPQFLKLLNNYICTYLFIFFPSQLYPTITVNLM